MKEKSKVLHDNGVCSLRDPLLERVEIGFGTLAPGMPRYRTGPHMHVKSHG